MAAAPTITSDEILISGDGHVAEPVDLWETRLPEKYREAAPKFPNIKYGVHNHARLGGRDPLARLEDMAVDGVSAELLYPTIANQGFKLQDRGAVLQAVMWRLRNQRLAFEPTDGVEVEAFGSISVYGPQGIYQLVVDGRRFTKKMIIMK